MKPTPKEGTPIHFRNIKEGDTIRSIQTKDCGTTIIIEGKVHSLCGDTLHFGEVKQGVSSAAVINNTGFSQSSLPAFYLLNRPLVESPITLLRTLPLNSIVEIHAESTYINEDYIIRGQLKKRIEEDGEESKGFSYEILGSHTGKKGTVIDKMRPCILEKRIKKLFILPQDLSSLPPNETTCTS